MKRLFIIIILSLCLFVFIVNASIEVDQALLAPVEHRGFDPLTQVFIRYDKIDWQTYDFYADVNIPETEISFYKWLVDGSLEYETPRIRAFFDEGRHQVTLLAVDRFGNRRHDIVQLSVQFWTLHNNSFWWFVYGFILIIVVYYWGVKLTYLFNRDKVKSQARELLDVLDTDGVIEHIVEHISSSIHKKR